MSSLFLYLRPSLANDSDILVLKKAAEDGLTVSA